jgi:hypothetical protein
LAGLGAAGEDRLLLVLGEEAVMGSLLGRLQAREEAARVRVEALQAEIAALAERLAAEEELVSRLQITKQTVIEVLADGDLPEDGVVASGSGTALASEASASTSGVQVPAFTQDGDGDGRGLPVVYRDMVEVLADAGVPLRAMQVCQALGQGVEPRHREGMRSKLKRLVRRGWLVEVEPGLFACAPGGGGVAGGPDVGRAVGR